MNKDTVSNEPPRSTTEKAGDQTELEKHNEFLGVALRLGVDQLRESLKCSPGVVEPDLNDPGKESVSALSAFNERGHVSPVLGKGLCNCLHSADCHVSPSVGSTGNVDPTSVGADQ